MTSSIRKIIGRVMLWFLLNITLLSIVLGTDLSDIEKPIWWKDVAPLIINILAGGLVSFFFYWLVVYEPERRKRQMMKSNFAAMYSRIKEDILYQVIFASKKGGRHDLHADRETLDKLLTVNGFKDAFSGGRQAHEGYYAFENQMSEETWEFREIVLSLELLAKQVGFLLHNYNMQDEEVFDFFKRLEVMLLRLRSSSAGYDESKALCSFIYQFFSGWSPIEGYLGYSVVEKNISRI